MVKLQTKDLNLHEKVTSAQFFSRAYFETTSDVKLVDILLLLLVNIFYAVAVGGAAILTF